MSDREHEQALARDLAARLVTLGVSAEVTDKRYVRAAVGERSLRVFCIWYELAVTGLMLGMNPANARRSLGAAYPAHEGAEYSVELFDGERDVASDRTPDVEQVVAAARAWLVDALPLAEVERAVPFVRRLSRAAHTIAATLDPGLRTSIGEDPSYELWVYGDRRSCRISPEGGSCAFWLGQAQVAFGASTDPAAVAAWLVERAPVGELAARFLAVALEPHAELLERDPARWHWQHLLARVAEPGDVLADQRALVEALAERPAVTAFYSFSSLFRLCFSASSHYPWVDDGLPIVWRWNDAYVVHTYTGAGEPVTCDLAGAVTAIEDKLAAYPIHPFFGSYVDHQRAPLAEALARRGSALRPAVVQSGAWFRLVVAAPPRSAELSGLSVTLYDAVRSGSLGVDSLDEAAHVICRFLDAGEPLDALQTS